MMEIWIRSIARAGGVEMPAPVHVLELRKRASRPSMRGELSRLLQNTARRLVRLAQRLDPGSDRAVPIG